MLLASLILSLAVSASEDTVCSTIDIKLSQELTFERQGFKGTFRVTNGLADKALSDIKVSVWFKNSEGLLVSASNNPQATDARFFLKLEDVSGFASSTIGANDSLSGATLAAKQTGEARWLIVPTAGAGGDVPAGKLYYVGVDFSYSLDGQVTTPAVEADPITVKPQPLLTMDYFIARDVLGDDPFTEALVEPSIPYTLGTRIINTGKSPAANVKLSTARPTIVDNAQGLAMGFSIVNAYVNDKPADNTLTLPYGDILPEGVKTGRWEMVSSLMGRFEGFEATVSHADALGGELTSLLKVNAPRFLVRDVRTDLAGRDALRDFLVTTTRDQLDQSDVKLYLYESEATRLTIPDLCLNCIEVAKQLLGESSMGSEMLLPNDARQRNVSVSVTSGFSYIRIKDPYQGTRRLTRVLRSDGKALRPENAWLSQVREKKQTESEYFINLFDYNSSDRYTVQFDGIALTPQAPEIQFVADKVIHENAELRFEVVATDANGTVPELTPDRLPLGAEFTRLAANKGELYWKPATGQKGSYQMMFLATDGAFETWRSINVKVNSTEDTDGDGLADAWEMTYFGSLQRDGTGDFDGDGQSDLAEYQSSSDPAQIPLAPAEPSIDLPVEGAVVAEGSPVLQVSNGRHPEAMLPRYHFELSREADFVTRLATVEKDEQDGHTAWVPSATELASGWQENQRYYWRVRAENAGSFSEWVYGSFIYSQVNDAPEVFAAAFPADMKQVTSLTPTLVVNNAHDPEGDELHYQFDVYLESDLSQPVSSSGAVVAGAHGETRWALPTALVNGQVYLWAASVRDTQGNSTLGPTQSFVVNTSATSPAIPQIAAPLLDSEWADKTHIDVSVSNAVSPSGNPLSYQFALSDSPTFEAGVTHESSVVSEGSNTTTWQFSNLSDNQQYYWRAKAIDGEVESDWRYGRFRVNALNDAPGVAEALNPGAGSWVSTVNPVLVASQVADPDDDALVYEFEVFSDELMTQKVSSGSAEFPFWAVTDTLASEHAYYWRVRARDDQGSLGVWSSLTRFYVKAEGSNEAPALTAFEVDTGRLASEQKVVLRWADADSDSHAYITLLADGQVIAKGIPEDSEGAGDQWVWDVSALSSGSHTVKAIIDDGVARSEQSAVLSLP